MHSRGRRGVTNIVLMMGVALAMAILLIGGVSLVAKFVQVQAQTSPKFVATELTTLINTVQAAPETVTFDYYTAINQDGYPVIGSLEIDDNNNVLCIGPKTENEIFGSIVDKAAMGAGFGAIGYTQNRVRSAVAQRATQKAIANQFKYDDLSKLGLSKKMLWTLGEDSEKGQLLRKYVLGKPLSKEEGLKFQEYFKTAGEKSEARIAKKVAPDLPVVVDALETVDKKPQGFVAKLKAKIPWTQEAKVSKVATDVESVTERNGQNPSTVERVGGSLVKGTKKSTIGAGGLVVAGGFATATYFLSGGDWTQTSITFAQMTIMNYAPKLMEKLLVRYVPAFAKRAVAQLPPGLVAANTASGAAGAAEKLPPPAAIPFWIVYGAAKLAETTVNIAFSIYNTVALDLTFAQIHEAASHQVAAERNSIDCESFVAPKKVLLTPPNCMPTVNYGSTFTSYYTGLGSETFRVAAASLWVDTGVAFTTAYPPSEAQILPRNLAIAAALAMIPSYGSLAYTIIKDPTGLIPKPGCSSSCDQTYQRQDCPNWFLSTPGLSGAGTQIAGYGFVAALNAGPVCAGLSLTGMAGMLCDISRVTTAIAIFLTAPNEVYNWFLQGDQVGLTKPVIASKTASEFPDLKGEFADNTGYWYAEFPYVVELNKVYTDDSSSAKRNPPLIIRKV